MSLEKKLTIKERKELNALLHYLWTRDVGTDGYDKSKWMDMEDLIVKGLGPVQVSNGRS